LQKSAENHQIPEEIICTPYQVPRNFTEGLQTFALVVEDTLFELQQLQQQDSELPESDVIAAVSKLYLFLNCVLWIFVADEDLAEFRYCVDRHVEILMDMLLLKLETKSMHRKYEEYYKTLNALQSTFCKSMSKWQT